MNTCSGLENPNPNPNLSRGGVSRPERRTDPPVGRISGWMARGQVTFPKNGPPLGQRARRMQIGKRCMATTNHIPSYGGSSFRTESRAIRTWRACLPIDPPVGRIIQKRPASGSLARKSGPPPGHPPPKLSSAKTTPHQEHASPISIVSIGFPGAMTHQLCAP